MLTFYFSIAGAMGAISTLIIIGLVFTSLREGERPNGFSLLWFLISGISICLISSLLWLPLLIVLIWVVSSLSRVIDEEGLEYEE